MNSTEPESEVCVVTGGTSGIGRETCRLFADAGYRIATCGRDKDRLSEVKTELGDAHLVVEADLVDVDQAAHLAEHVIHEFGRIDVLVNNAALAPLSPFSDVSSETFEDTLNVNIRSPFYLTQIVWQRMVEQGRGVIVNMSSLAAIDPFPGFNIYGASKAWLDVITTALKTEGEPHGIRVYSIRAGAVETPMLRRTFPDFPADQCVSSNDIASAIMACVQNQHESGTHLVVANQT